MLRELELEGWGCVLWPSPDLDEPLFAGRVQEIAGLGVLEPRLFAKSGFEYARAQRLLRTPKVELVLGVVTHFPEPFRLWMPLQLYWPDGKPDLGALTTIPRTGDLPLFVHFGLFHCERCETDVDAFAIRLEVYHHSSYPGLPETRALLKRCPACGADRRDAGIVEITHVWKK